MTSDDLLRLLRARHEDDIFVPECKNGPTSVFGANVLKFDALVFKRSWQLPCFDGYEIKISRSDFNRDTKWPGYLESCHRFWFVCPYGLIEPDELPAEVGLIWAHKEGGGLRVKRKAKHRPIAEAAILNIYRYLLFSRAKFDAEKIEDPKTRYENWLYQHRNNQSLGHKHGQRVRAMLQKEIYDVQAEMRQTQNENAGYAQLKKMVEDLGLNTAWRPADRLADMLRKHAIPFDETFVSSMESMQRALTNAIARMETANRQARLSAGCANLVDGYEI